MENKNIKIAIASGKGGTGKTLISTNLFYSLQHNKIPVTLIDCDAEEPNDMIFFEGTHLKKEIVNQKIPIIDYNNCIFCSKCAEYCNYNAIFILPQQKIINVIDDLCHSCGACWVACKSDAINEKVISIGEVNHYHIKKDTKIIESKINIGVYSPVNVIKQALKNIEINTITILDSPPGTSCPFVTTVLQADFVVLVTEPTPFGLSDLKQSVETLKSLNLKYAVIINKAELGDDKIFEYLKDENIEILLKLKFNKKIAKQYSEGKLIAQNSEYNKLFFDLFKKILKSYGNSNN